MSRFVRNPGVQIAATTPERARAALTGFNNQPVTTAEQLAAARELAASYSTSKGVNMSSTDHADHAETDRAEAAAAGRAAASVELGRELAEQHMTPEQRKRAAELRARRDAAELE